MATFRGERVLFIQNAHLRGLTGFVGDVARPDYLTDLTANMIGPIAAGESFLHAVIGSRYQGEAGLVMLSSASARSPYEGQSVYCAGKAAIEMWVRVVRRERPNIWVTAVRPGFVDTATTQRRAPSGRLCRRGNRCWCSVNASQVVGDPSDRIPCAACAGGCAISASLAPGNPRVASHAR